MWKQDVKTFLTQYKVATFLGTVPFKFGNGNMFVVKIYPLVILLLFVITTLYSILERKSLYSTVKITYIVIDCLLSISEILFIFSCVLGSIKHSKNWKIFHDTLQQLEKKLDQTDFSSDNNPLLYSLGLIVVHVVFIALHYVENYFWISNNEKDIVFSYMTSRFVMYYQIYSVILICGVSGILRRRFIFLNKYLKKTVDGQWTSINRLQMQKESGIFWKMNETGDIYGIIFDLVEQFNMIFGWQIFFLLEYSSLKILNIINYVLQSYGKYGGSKSIQGLDVAYLGAFSILAASVVMACDSVTKSGRKIIDTCYLLQMGMPTSMLKKELLFLGHYTKELSPRFTAAGFYQVQQSVLAALFSAVTTYLIICIQFNMTL